MPQRKTRPGLLGSVLGQVGVHVPERRVKIRRHLVIGWDGDASGGNKQGRNGLEDDSVVGHSILPFNLAQAGRDARQACLLLRDMVLRLGVAQLQHAAQVVQRGPRAARPQSGPAKSQESLSAKMRLRRGNWATE